MRTPHPSLYVRLRPPPEFMPTLLARLGHVVLLPPQGLPASIGLNDLPGNQGTWSMLPLRARFDGFPEVPEDPFWEGPLDR